MFKGLRETIKGLNSDVNNVANSQRAKKLRKNLLIIGFILAIVGIIGFAVCVILLFSNFSDIGDSFSSSMDTDGIDSGFGNFGSIVKKMFVPIGIAIPFMIMLGIGVVLIKLGFSIVIAGYASDLIDDAVGNNCPNCGTRIEGDKAFCPKCGKQLNKTCSNCGHVNHFKNVHCEKCGTKL